MFQFLFNNKIKQNKNYFIVYCAALLSTIKLSPESNAVPIQILENIKNVRVKYENQSKSEAILQSNIHSSIGERRSFVFFSSSFSKHFNLCHSLKHSNIVYTSRCQCCSYQTVIEFKFLDRFTWSKWWHDFLWKFNNNKSHDVIDFRKLCP